MLVRPGVSAILGPVQRKGRIGDFARLYVQRKLRVKNTLVFIRDVARDSLSNDGRAGVVVVIE